jgi:hypothetical protein
MPVNLGEEFREKAAELEELGRIVLKKENKPDPQLTKQIELLHQVVQALHLIKQAIDFIPPPPEMPEIPAPIINVEPQDLTDIVTAVNGLKPGANAQDIAEAVKTVLVPSTNGDSKETTSTLKAVAKALEELSFRLKGVGTQAYGGGTVSLARNSSINVSNLPADLDPDGGVKVHVQNPVAASGGGTEFAEDVAHSSGALGTLSLGVRNDNAAALTSADGDYSGFATDSAGRVGIADLGGSVTVDGPVTDGQLRATPVPVSGTVTANAGTGPFPVSDNGGSLTVDGTVGVSGVVDVTPASPAGNDYLPVRLSDGTSFYNATGGGGGGGTEFAEDSAHTTGALGTLGLGVRNDAASALTSADGDYSAVATDSAGRVGITDLGGVISIDDNGGSLTVDGPVTDTQLRATPVPISGTVTANAGTGPFPVSDNGGSLTVDGSVSITGAVDTELTTQDYDSGAGTATTAVAGLVVPASGGPVAIPGDTSNGLDVDVTRLPSLPAGTNNIGDVDVLSSALPTGAATSAKQDTVIGHLDGVEGLLTTIDADTGTLAGAVSGAEMQVDVVTMPNVTLNEPVSIDDNGGSVTVDGTVGVSNLNTADYDTGAGTVTEAMIGLALPASGGPVAGGTATNPVRTDPTGSTTQPVSGTVTANAGTGPFPVSDNGGSLTVDGSVSLATAIPAGTNNIGDVDVLSLPALPAGSNNIGDVDVLTLPAITGTVTSNAGTGTFATKETQPGTATLTNVANSVSSAQALASNTSRRQATFYNDDTDASVYLKFGTTASSTSFTIKIAPGGYYEIPAPIYTGRIDVIATAATGTLRVTEIT